MEGRLTRMPHVNELHEQHDQILVVSFASGDLAPDDRDRTVAQSLVDSCAECARLHDDVLAIARATRALPPAVRTRDFQISPEQAAKLQPGGWRRFVAAFAAPGSIFSKQLGVGLATLGVAGLLLSSLGSISLGSFGGAASASAAPGANRAAAPAYPSGGSQPAALLPAPSAAASAAGGPLDVPTVASGAAASEAPGFDTLGGSDNGIGTTTQGSTGKTTPSPTQRELIVAAPSPEASRVAVSQSSADANANGPSGLVVFSVVLLGAGVLVLLLRSISRRVSAR